MSRSVTQWLEQLGLGQYAKAFEENAIAPEHLAELDHETLKEIGVRAVGHRMTILKAAAITTRPGPPAGDLAQVPDGERPRVDARIVTTPAHLAKRIEASRATMEGERKQVTVMFADIAGSTDLMHNLDAEQATRLMEPALAAMVKSVHRYEGTVARVQGDGIMALFGAPLSYEDHALRACYAALDLQRRMQRVTEGIRDDFGVLLRVRVGLNSGEVVIKSLGSDLRMDYEAIGMVVHLAARMESLAAPGAIQLTAQTMRFVEGFVEAESLGLVPVKGAGGGLEVFALTGLGSARTRLQASMRSGAARFVGREFEIQVLEKALNETLTGRGQLVALTGEAGIGKSRLIHELTRRPSATKCSLLQATATSYGKSADWSLLSDMLREYCDIEFEDAQEDILEKVTEKVLRADDSSAQTLPALLSLLDIDPNDPAWELLEPKQRIMRTLNAVHRLLTAECRMKPLILVLEDLHWADDASIEFFDRFVETLASKPILLIASFRPDFGHAWEKLSAHTQLRVEALSKDASKALIDELFQASSDVPNFKRALFERSQGNPLFIEEVMREMRGKEMLRDGTSRQGITNPVDGFAMPESVQAIISARIDRLPRSAKELLQLVSLIADEVPLALLLAVADDSQESTRRDLAILSDSGFLFESEFYPEEQFSFRNPLSREVASSGLLGDARQARHVRIGAVLEEIVEDRPVESVEVIAHHFEQGEAWDRAARYKLYPSVA